jgi:ABC-type transporter Mla subunit MlaD
LNVVAVELRQHAIHLEKSAARTLTALDSLSAAAGPLGRGARGEHPEEGGAGTAAAALSGSVARIRKAGDGVESDLQAVAKQGADAVDMLRRAADRFDFHRQIGSVLDQAVDELTAMAGPSGARADDIGAALRPLLADIAKTYTMAQEREVHSRLTATLGAEAPQPAREPELF